MRDFPLLPPQASAMSARVDLLMIYICAVALCFAGMIAGLIVFYCVKYHHRRQADRSNPVFDSLPLELAWTGVPLALTLSMFYWGAELFVEMREAPPDAMEIYVVGKQWMWEIQHPEGRRELNEVHVPIGRPVKLLMTSQDVIHSFFVPDFRVKQDVLPGRYASLWFEAVAPGRYRLYCAQYCGTSHSAMTGGIVALTPADYERWLASDEAPDAGRGASLEASGERLFARLACASCHQADGNGRGPSLAGLFGARVALAGGGTSLADEDYLRESILKPAAKIVKGYAPLMPAFEGRLNEEQLLQLIAYIKSLRKRP